MARNYDRDTIKTAGKTTEKIAKTAGQEARDVVETTGKEYKESVKETEQSTNKVIDNCASAAMFFSPGFRTKSVRLQKSLRN